MIGPNGAGKTTFIDAITGFLPNNSVGSVLLEGEEVFGRSPHVLSHDGLTRTWQTLELFDDITVRSNLDVASRRLTIGVPRWLDLPGGPARRADRVDEVLELAQSGRHRRAPAP